MWIRTLKFREVICPGSFPQASGEFRIWTHPSSKWLHNLWAFLHVLLSYESEALIVNVDSSSGADSTWPDFISENFSFLGILMFKSRMERNHKMWRRNIDSFTDELYKAEEVLIMTVINILSFKYSLSLPLFLPSGGN